MILSPENLQLIEKVHIKMNLTIFGANIYSVCPNLRCNDDVR